MKRKGRKGKKIIKVRKQKIIQNSKEFLNVPNIIQIENKLIC